MKRIWVIRDERIRRDRTGKAFRRVQLGIEAHGLRYADGSLENSSGARVEIGSGTEHRMLEMLLLSRTRIARADFIQELWPDADFEPDSSDRIVGIRLCALRRKLHKLGYELDCVYFRGWSLRTRSAPLGVEVL